MRVLLAGIFAAALVFAQDEGAGAGGMRGMGGRGGGMGGGDSMGMGAGMPRMQRQSKLEMLSDKLKLNREQQQELLRILQAAREESAPLNEAIDKERANIANSILNSKPDAQKKAVEDLAALRTKMVAVEAKAFSRIVALMKVKDQAKAPQTFELLAGIFDAPPPIGGPGRRN